VLYVLLRFKGFMLLYLKAVIVVVDSVKISKLIPFAHALFGRDLSYLDDSSSDGFVFV